jgi:hypothetical protein
MRAVNLIPPEQRRGAGGLAGRTGGVVYVVQGMLVVLVALGVVYALAVHQVAARKATLAQVTAEATTIQGEVAALQPYVSFESLTQQRVSSVVALAEQRFDWPQAMEQISLALPSNVTLSSISGTATGGGPTAASTTPAATTTTTTTPATGTTTPPATSTTTPTTPGTTAGSSAVSTTASAPTLSISGCAFNSGSQDAQVTVANMIERFRALTDVSSAMVPNYAKGTCDGRSGLTFAMTVTYNNSYGLPATHLAASPDTTVGG